MEVGPARYETAKPFISHFHNGNRQVHGFYRPYFMIQEAESREENWLYPRSPPSSLGPVQIPAGRFIKESENCFLEQTTYENIYEISGWLGMINICECQSHKIILGNEPPKIIICKCIFNYSRNCHAFALMSIDPVTFFFLREFFPQYLPNKSS